MKGIQKWRTPDGVTVLRIHYTADPAKDPDTVEGLGWLMKALQGYKGGMDGVDWRREMEIDWQIRGARQVFPHFDRDIAPHVVVEPFSIPKHWPVYFGFDYGYRAPFAIAVIAFKTPIDAFLVDEIYLKEVPIHEQARHALENMFYPQMKYCIGDPSIWHKTQHDPSSRRVTSLGQMLKEAGLFVREGRNEPGVDLAYRDLLLGSLWRNPKAARFHVFNTCTNFLHEIRNLKFKDHHTKRAREEESPPEKLASAATHLWDATKYVMLSRPAVVPMKDEIPPDSLEALKRELFERKRLQRNVL